ncbi:hypothetical protein A2V82_09555 [candidate division KSB1 bacterium RBG_16_48_16]|nr:MAG: hypothetical protein A2V82_09555 [candidate division KSB1 bacterium RBG_16_48_16]
MRQHKYEIIVGIAIIAAIVVATFGYIFIREVPVRKNGLEVTIYFNNVSGLTQGDAVKVSGVKVGRVKGIDLVRDRVAVRVWLDGKVPFARDSKAFIKSIGMIGEKYIDLMPGYAPEYLASKDTITGEYAADLADVGGPISDLISQATSILTKLNDTIQERNLIQAQEDALASLKNINYVTTQVASRFDANFALMEKSLANVNALTDELLLFWQNNDAGMNRNLADISTSISRLPEIMAKLDSSLTVTQTLLADLRDGNGSVGMALASDELYQKTNQTISDMQILLADMKKRPGKYFKANFIDLF